MDASIKKWMTGLSITATVATLAVIALGAFVRLSDAGLGCPDWPTCYGHILWPQTEADQHIANQSFASTPVIAGKTWPEQVHRLFASSLGLLSLSLFFLAFKLSKHTTCRAISAIAVASMLILLQLRLFFASYWQYSEAPVYDSLDPIVACCALIILALVLSRFFWSQEKRLLLATLSVVVVIIQGLFGMWTVTLKLWPQVVTAHLMGGMTLASVFCLLALTSSAKAPALNTTQSYQLSRLKPIALTCLLLVFGQVFLGGWVTSNYAAVACPDFPTCQWQWWPESDFSRGFDFLQMIGPNYLGGQLANEARTAIHLAHRLGAMLISIVLIIFFIRLWQVRSRSVNRLVLLSGGILLAQVGLGIANVLFHFPVFIAVLHNLFAAFLLLSIVSINYRVLNQAAVAYRRECA